MFRTYSLPHLTPPANSALQAESAVHADSYAIGSLAVESEADTGQVLPRATTRPRTGSETGLARLRQQLALSGHVIQYSSQTAREPDPVTPAMAWVMSDTGSSNLVVADLQALDDARRQIYGILRTRGHNVVYLHGLDAVATHEHQMTFDNGALTPADGPLRRLLKEGGTIILNLANFNPSELGAFNTLLEERIWEDIQVEKETTLRIIAIMDEDTMRAGVMSGAWISRMDRFRHMEDHTFRPSGVLPLSVPQDEYHFDSEPQIIDLEGDAWQPKLLGMYDVGPNQSWIRQEGLIDRESKQPLVIRNPRLTPHIDPYLLDFLLEMKAEGRQILVESGIPPAEKESRLSTKRPASHHTLFERLCDPYGQVCVVNAVTITDVIKPHYVVQNGLPSKRPSLLDSMSADFPGERILVYIAGNIDPGYWHRLMRHPAAIDFVMERDLYIPEEYWCQVSRMPTAEVKSSPVTVHYCHDTELVSRPADSLTAHIYVTPETRARALVGGLTVDEKAGRNENGIPRVKYVTGALTKALRSGQTVYLHGLDNNPELMEELASLLKPPHYLYLNGERYSFARYGELRGELRVVTSQKEVVQQLALVRLVDETEGQQDWRNKVLDKLKKDFPSANGPQAAAWLDRLCRLVDVLNKLGISPQEARPSAEAGPLPFATVKTLFGQLEAYKVQDQLDNRDSVSNLVLRSLYKDMLIGDLREADPLLDQVYPLAKLIFDQIFSALSCRPENSVRLGTMTTWLHHASHIDDITNQAWRYLRLFSPDIVRTLMADSLEALENDDLEPHQFVPKMRLCIADLVLDQAARQELPLCGTLQKLIADAGQRLDPALQRTLFNDLNYTKSAQNPKNMQKLTHILQHGRGVFMKGPPGAGKTWLMLALAGKVGHTANVADAGTAAYEKILAKWAADPAYANAARRIWLQLDEANLLKNGMHDPLNGLFNNNSLFADGQIHSGLQHHGVLATGNQDSELGRHRHQVLQKWIPTLQIKSKRTDTLAQDFSTRLLDLAQERLGLPQLPALREQIMQRTQVIHERLQNTLPTVNLSGRNLAEYQLQTLEAIAHLDIHDPAALDDAMAACAELTYAGAVPSHAREVVTTCINVMFRRENQNADRLSAQPAQLDLAKKGLAATPSTLKLAHTICWWLQRRKTQQKLAVDGKVPGQLGLLIEGAASRGKDALVVAILELLKIPFCRINPNTSKIGYLSDVVSECAEKGMLVLISELNLFPTGVLETILNGRLTGDHYAAPGFGVIATINPAGDDAGYAGTQALSTAFENRFLKAIAPEYPASEIPAIARALALQQARKSGLRSSVKIEPLDGKMLDTIIARHMRLLGDLKAFPEQFSPKIRQLRKAIAARHLDRRPEADYADPGYYDFYELLSTEEGPEILNMYEDYRSRTRPQQLTMASRFICPDAIAFPNFYGDNDELPPGSLLSYNAQHHRIYFKEDAPLSGLVRSLESHFKVKDPFTRHVPALTAAQSQAPKMAADAWDEDDWEHPALSAGDADFESIPGGRVIGVETGSLLVADMMDLAGHRIKLPKVVIDDDKEAAMIADGSDGPREVFMNEAEIVISKDNQLCIGLPSPSGWRPAGVVLANVPVTSLSRDSTGQWTGAIAQDFAQRIKNSSDENERRLSYRLVPFDEPVITVPDTGNINLEKLPYFKRLEAIRRSYDPDHPESAIEQVRQLMREPGHFFYSSKNAQVLKKNRTVTGWMQSYLENGHGVCQESAFGGGQLLKQLLGLSVVIVGGLRVDNAHQFLKNQHARTYYINKAGTLVPVEMVSPHVFSKEEAKGVEKSTAANYAQAASEAVSAPLLPAKTDFPYIALNLPKSFDEHFRAKDFVGIHWELQVKAEAFNAEYFGEMVLERVIANRPDNHRSPAAKPTARPRDVHLQFMPHFADASDAYRFYCRTGFALERLIQGGVRIFGLNHMQTTIKVSSLPALKRLYRSQKAEPDHVIQNNHAVVADTGEGGFFDRLASYYTSALMASEKVAPGDVNAAREVWVKYHGEQILEMSSEEFFPIKIPVFGQEISIGIEELRAAQSARIEALPTDLKKVSAYFKLLETATLTEKASTKEHPGWGYVERYFLNDKLADKPLTERIAALVALSHAGHNIDFKVIELRLKAIRALMDTISFSAEPVAMRRVYDQDTYTELKCAVIDQAIATVTREHRMNALDDLEQALLAGLTVLASIKSGSARMEDFYFDKMTLDDMINRDPENARSYADKKIEQSVLRAKNELLVKYAQLYKDELERVQDTAWMQWVEAMYADVESDSDELEPEPKEQPLPDPSDKLPKGWERFTM